MKNWFKEQVGAIKFRIARWAINGTGFSIVKFEKVGGTTYLRRVDGVMYALREKKK